MTATTKNEIERSPLKAASTASVQTEFMRALGVYNSSGRTQTQLRNQMKRLFGCSVSLIGKDEHREAAATALIAELTDFWWARSEGVGDWKIKIRLGEAFFNEIISHPAPPRLAAGDPPVRSGSRQSQR